MASQSLLLVSQHVCQRRDAFCDDRTVCQLSQVTVSVAHIYRFGVGYVRVLLYSDLRTLHTACLSVQAGAADSASITVCGIPLCFAAVLSQHSSASKFIALFCSKYPQHVAVCSKQIEFVS